MRDRLIVRLISLLMSIIRLGSVTDPNGWKWDLRDPPVKPRRR
jgi:hypothetical protein